MTTTTPEALQRRVLIVLVAGQVLSGAGMAAGATVGALLAQDMLGSTSLAGLTSAVATIGSALAAGAVGRLSNARGRRPGLVIAIHIGTMYLPSPLTGWLVDRYGRRPIAVAAGLTLLAAGVVAASADSVPTYAVALALLGLGWNFGLVAGTAIITDAVPPATRARTQGQVDVAVAIAGATGGMASGLVVAAAGYPLLAAGGGVLALAIVPTVVRRSR